MKIVLRLLITVIVIGIIVIWSSVYTINEAQQVVITQFGEPIGEPVMDPGLHFKIPLIQVANVFDKRYLGWDGEPNQLTTKDKRFIWVDTYARWRISNPLLFLKRVANQRSAQSRLDDILDGKCRQVIAQHNLVEVIRSTNREPVRSEMIDDSIEQSFAIIHVGRKKIEKTIYELSYESIAEMGIELLDFRFKRINYTPEVQKEINERMISERQRIAEQYRSEGNGEYMRIMGEKERELKRIQSEAYRKAQTIIGDGDAKAVRIYADAYNRNDECRDFYAFLKTMETYKDTFTDKDTLILSTGSDFYRYLKDGSGKPGPAAVPKAGQNN